MKNKHIFSERYETRKIAVISALKSYETEHKNTHAKLRLPTKIFISAAVLAAITVSAFAAAKWIEFRVERDGDNVKIHAGLNETGTSNKAEKPLRSWRSEEGEISIKLNIPDMPTDITEDKTANGKYGSADSSRSLTFSAVDLRRGDLDQLTAGVTDVTRFDADGREGYVLKTGDANYYNRTAYMVFEEDELVIKAWVSYGVTDEELTAMLTTLALEETSDPSVAIPVLNEFTDTGDDPIIFENVNTSEFSRELSEMDESVRDAWERYTVTVKSVEVFDDVKTLDLKHVIYKDMFYRFVDGEGNLPPYTRTEIVVNYNDDGSFTKEFGESVPMKKKLFVATIAMTDLDFSDTDKAERETMLHACINGFELDGYTHDEEDIKITSMNAVVDRKLHQHSGNGEMVYRQELGGGLWKVAFLVDEDIASGNLVLHSYSSKIYIKIK